MKPFSLFIIGLFFSFFCIAQANFPSLSPKGKISQVVGNTQISIEYERPAVRNRIIFGGLVPWNKVWRTGAGYCTKISFDKDVIVGGQTVGAGTYSLFTIPTPTQWTVILNSDVSLYGSYDYDSEKDVARFIVRPTTSQRFYETMTLDIDVVPNDAVIYFSWANIQISFPVETTTDQEVRAYISQDLLTGKSTDAEQYVLFAEYLLIHNLDFFNAIQLTDKSMELEETEYAYRIKMEVLEKIGNTSEALEIARKGKIFVEGREFGSELGKERTIKIWQDAINRLQKQLDGEE